MALNAEIRANNCVNTDGKKRRSFLALLFADYAKRWAARRLLEQPELRLQLGEAARAKVQGAHSWDAYGASVLQAIDARRLQQVQRGVQLS